MAKKKGDLLELIVNILERSFIDNPNTKIKPNARIKDSAGIKRDIDVYFEVKVNKKKLKYGIECKHFSPKTPLKIGHVDELIGKIQNSGINGIIVTTGPIQTGAKEKALKFNIALHKIEEIKDEKFLKESHQLLFQKKIIDYYLTTTDLPNNHHLSSNDHPEYLYIGDLKKKIKLTDYFKINLLPNIHDETHKIMETLFGDLVDFSSNQLNVKTDKKIMKIVKVSIKGLFYKHEDKFYQMTGCEVEFLLWVEREIIKNPAVYKYYDVFNDETFAEYSARLIRLDDKEYQNVIIKDKSTGIVRAMIGELEDKNNIWEEDLTTFNDISK